MVSNFIQRNNCWTKLHITSYHQEMSFADVTCPIEKLDSLVWLHIIDTFVMFIIIIIIIIITTIDTFMINPMCQLTRRRWLVYLVQQCSTLLPVALFFFGLCKTKYLLTLIINAPHWVSPETMSSTQLISKQQIYRWDTTPDLMYDGWQLQVAMLCMATYMIVMKYDNCDYKDCYSYQSRTQFYISRSCHGPSETSVQSVHLRLGMVVGKCKHSPFL